MSLAVLLTAEALSSLIDHAPGTDHCLLQAALHSLNKLTTLSFLRLQHRAECVAVFWILKSVLDLVIKAGWYLATYP